jgi:tRNA dimethylallyltransferase
LAAVPPIPAEIRAAVRERLTNEGVAPLYAELQQRDPATAQRLLPGDRSRIARALEVVTATGRSLSDWHREGLPPYLNAVDTVRIFLQVDRAELRRRIDARFDAMLAGGALEEVQKLAARKLDPSLPAMKAHGVPWLIRHLRGELGLAEAADGGKRDTRRYTKRQETWFRHQMQDWTGVPPEQASAVASAYLISGLWHTSRIP